MTEFLKLVQETEYQDGKYGSILSQEEIRVKRLEARERSIRKVEEREHLRQELKARAYIHTVHGIVDVLVQGQEPERQADGRPIPGAPMLPLDRTRVQSLKTAMDGCLRLLDRTLPPLKAIEIQDSPEKEADITRLSTSELMKMFLRGAQAPNEIEGEVIYEEVEVPDSNEVPPWE